MHAPVNRDRLVTVVAKTLVNTRTTSALSVNILQVALTLTKARALRCVRLSVSSGSLTKRAFVPRQHVVY